MRLSFTLKGRQLLPYLILLYIFVGVPYIFLFFRPAISGHGDPLLPGSEIFSFIYILLAIFVIYGTLEKVISLEISHIQLGDRSFFFDGDVLLFLWIMISGLLLSGITLGIYTPWFIRRVHRFFIENTYFRSLSFRFRAKAVTLLWKMVLGLIFYFAVMGLVVSKIVNYPAMGPDDGYFMLWIKSLPVQLALVVLSSPLTYIYWVWSLDISYKDLGLEHRFSTVRTIGFIIREMTLSYVTFGLYGPIFFLHAYIYFFEHISFRSDRDSREVSFSIIGDRKEMYLTAVKQFLLSVITLGIYTPWAICRIFSCYLDHTEVNLTGEEEHAAAGQELLT